MALRPHSWTAYSGRGLTCCPAIKPEVTSPEGWGWVLATNSQLNLNMSGVHPSPLGVAMETKEQGPQHPGTSRESAVIFAGTPASSPSSGAVLCIWALAIECTHLGMMWITALSPFPRGGGVHL